MTYRYENTISRLSQRIDEKLQVTQYDYNRDDTLSRITYNNAMVATPPVDFAYDASYSRLRSMIDGTGTTRYRYFPIAPTPSLGAGQLMSVDGTLPDDTITFEYDELGRRVSTAINGVGSSVTYDSAGRVIANVNALGVFKNTYEGNSFRTSSQSYPNGQTVEFDYADNLQDHHLSRITNRLGITPVSEFIYGRDVPTGRITSWSQQAGTQAPSIYGLSYDAVDQLTAASVSEGGKVVKSFGYSYDPGGNRLTERVDAITRQFSYNALNELTSVEGENGLDATYQWDAEHRLVSISSGDQETHFTYDGIGRRVGLREVVNGAEVSNRRFVWCDNEICEERTPAGIVSKRFFPQGMKVETGATSGKYFYARDHLGSVRELIDEGGSVRARFSYDPYGVQSRIAGDLESDFGFTGHFYHAATGLDLTLFRAYDSGVACWLSREPFPNAEMLLGPNLFEYVHNDPINLIDSSGRTPAGHKYVEIVRLILSFLNVSPNSRPPKNPEPVPVEPAPQPANPGGPPPKEPKSPKIPPGRRCVQRIINGCEEGCAAAVCQDLCVVLCTSIAVPDEYLGSGGYCP